MSDETAIALQGATALCAREGLPLPASLTRLAGGKNNQVWCMTCEAGPDRVLKRYFSDVRDTRDRLGAEWAFIVRANGRGITCIPEPLACDPQAHLGLYSLLPGGKLAPGGVDADHVAQAAAFIVSLNAAPRAPRALAAASEACFSLSEHLAAVERRIARLDTIDAEAPLATEARALANGTLGPAWAAVKTRIATEAHGLGLALDRPIDDGDLIVSPSDFGFHNALEGPDGRLGFIDFEYAGHDDPAKLVCDFFCQPDIPVPVQHFDAFIAATIGALGLSPDQPARCRLLLDACRIKWACIMLNDFLPMDGARRAFSQGLERESRCAGQLAKARAALAALG